MDCRCISSTITTLSPSGENSSKPGFSQLPEPTWSIASLELDKNHTPVSEEELALLAKRALIDVPSDPQARGSLRQDLGNMIHMIQTVKDFAADEELTDEDIYDRPRGVTMAPVHRSTESSEAEQEEMRQVWDSLLKPKTTNVGAHPYFVIETKRD